MNAYALCPELKLIHPYNPCMYLQWKTG